MASIQQARKGATSAVDSRALDLLELMVERRAAEVQNQPGQHVPRALAALQRAQQEGAVLQLLAPQETAPDWSGDARLKDAETGLEREFTATPLTQGSYLRALAERTDAIERAAHRRGLRFARLSTAEPIDEMVQITLRRLGLLA